ncbi:hypothetical protein PILCRDRAFT_815966, partial [Piloderma croceum F 1598]
MPAAQLINAWRGSRATTSSASSRKQAACFRFAEASQPGTGAAEAPNQADAKKMMVIVLENMVMVMMT